MRVKVPPILRIDLGKFLVSQANWLAEVINLGQEMF